MLHLVRITVLMFCTVAFATCSLRGEDTYCALCFKKRNVTNAREDLFCPKCRMAISTPPLRTAIQESAHVTYIQRVSPPESRPCSPPVINRRFRDQQLEILRPNPQYSQLVLYYNNLIAAQNANMADFMDLDVAKRLIDQTNVPRELPLDEVWDMLLPCIDLKDSQEVSRRKVQAMMIATIFQAQLHNYNTHLSLPIRTNCTKDLLDDRYERSEHLAFLALLNRIRLLEFPQLVKPEYVEILTTNKIKDTERNELYNRVVRECALGWPVFESHELAHKYLRMMPTTGCLHPYRITELLSSKGLVYLVVPEIGIHIQRLHLGQQQPTATTTAKTTTTAESAVAPAPVAAIPPPPPVAPDNGSHQILSWDEWSRRNPLNTLKAAIDMAPPPTLLPLPLPTTIIPPHLEFLLERAAEQISWIPRGDKPADRAGAASLFAPQPQPARDSEPEIVAMEGSTAIVGLHAAAPALAAVATTGAPAPTTAATTTSTATTAATVAAAAPVPNPTTITAKTKGLLSFFFGYCQKFYEKYEK